jgi:signal peptidase I
MTGTFLSHHVSESSKAALVEDLLVATGRAQIRAFGVSMLPCLWPGDVLTIQSAHTADLSVGEILIVKQNDGWVAHRIAASSATQLITRGDSVPENDPPIHLGYVIGKVVSVTRGSKEFVPKRLSRPQRCLAWLLCHFGPFRNLMLNLHRARETRIYSEVSSKFKPTTAS